MIESAIYPHCVADSSPAASNTSQDGTHHEIQRRVGEVDVGQDDEIVDGNESVPDVDETEVAREEPVSSSAFTAGILAVGQESDNTQDSAGSAIATTSQRMVNDASVPDLQLVIGSQKPIKESAAASMDNLVSPSGSPGHVVADVRQRSECDEGQDGIEVSAPGSENNESGRAKDEDFEAKSPDIQMQLEGPDAKGVEGSRCRGESLLSPILISLLMRLYVFSRPSFNR